MKKMLLHQVRGYSRIGKKVRAQVHENLSQRVMIVVEDQANEFIYRDAIDLVRSQVAREVRR